jgi:hypothetical protein
VDVASGPIRDTKGILLGDPAGPGSPDFGAGSHGGDLGSLAGSGVGGLDPRNSDPSPEADTGVQTTGPEERDTTHNVAGLTSAPTGSTGTSDASSSDSSGADAPAAVSPLHGLLQTHLVPDNLTADDDTSDDPGNDADG